MDPRRIYRGAGDPPLTCSGSYVEKKIYNKNNKARGGMVREERKEEERKIIMKPVNCLSARFKNRLSGGQLSKS